MTERARKKRWPIAVILQLEQLKCVCVIQDFSILRTRVGIAFSSEKIGHWNISIMVRFIAV